MERQSQRIVAAAVVERIGPVTAHDLLAMPDNSWGVLRDRITDRRYGKDGLLATCMACGGEVYIRTARTRDSDVHYSHTMRGVTQTARGIRAATSSRRMRGQRNTRESKIEFSPNHVRASCRTRRDGSTTLGTRWLNISHRQKARMVASQTSMSSGKGSDHSQSSLRCRDFPDGISARCKHYEREGIPLLWVLFGIDTDSQISQSFLDVIRRHRGNAFVLDTRAIEASKKQRTLVLSCYLKSEHEFNPPELVRFDELTIPRSKLPYYEDRIVGPRLSEDDSAAGRGLRHSTVGFDPPLFGLELQPVRLVAAAFQFLQPRTARSAIMRVGIKTFARCSTPFCILEHLRPTQNC